jgi:carbonic anhydrase/acetyltransferase-like protein (isoleucine patch superfamily)
MFYDLKDKKPQNSGENWVAPNATIIGDVTLEKNSSIWFNAVLRGDIENIHIGEGQIFKMVVFYTLILVAL